MYLSILLIAESTMKWMHKVVVPNVCHCWWKIADYLGYPIPKKKEIERKQRGNPYDCCVELMEDWLSSDRGVTPKTWHTLVSVLRDISDLSSVSHSIEQQLVKEGLL